MLQAGRSQVRVPMRLLNFVFNLPNPSSRTMALGFTQPVTEINARNRKKSFGGVERGHRVRLTSLPYVSRLYRQCGILNISQPYKPPRPVTEVVYFMETGCASCEVRTGL
jgi:hypothetical protein